MGRRGGFGKWPVCIVLLIFEILFNVTPPSDEPANIQTVSAEFTVTAACELPSIDFFLK